MGHIKQDYKFDFFERFEERGKIILAPLYKLKSKECKYERQFIHPSKSRMIDLYHNGYLTGDAHHYVEKDLLGINKEDGIFL